MSLVYVKVYGTDKGKMVACCDEDLMGKTFRDGKLRLSLETRFYGNSLLGIREAMILLEQADVLNLVGRNVVDAAIHGGIVHPDAVISIAGIPHVQVMRL